MEEIEIGDEVKEITTGGIGKVVSIVHRGVFVELKGKVLKSTTLDKDGPVKNNYYEEGTVMYWPSSNLRRSDEK